MSVAGAVLMAFVVLGAQPQAARDLVDLRRIGHISKGRVQDQDLPVVENLIKAGPASVPFLVSKLEDRTRIPGYGTVLDFWPRVEVGHVALFVLCDLFTEADGRTSTVPGLNCGDILEQDPDVPSWEVYDNFVAKYGRAGIRSRVERLVAPHRDRILWDATERCFRPRA